MLLHPEVGLKSPENPYGFSPSLGRVLVVSAMGELASTVMRALRDEQFDVIEATTGLVALEAACLSVVDAVVLDVSLTEAEAVECCLRLKQAAITALPVLCLSSRTSRDARARALDAGLDGYLTFPFTSTDLRAALGALIRAKRQGEQRSFASGPKDAVLADVLNALTDHVALLDVDGRILAVNSAWNAFAASHGFVGDRAGLGTSYLRVCDESIGARGNEAHAAGAGIRSVLSGRIPSFELDYPCSAPDADRWFRMIVRPVSCSEKVCAIVMHVERTSERLATIAKEEAFSAGEANRLRLEATLEALPVGVWLADAGGHLTKANQAAARLWGGTAPLSQSIDDYAVYSGRWPSTGLALEPEDWPIARTIRTGLAIPDELVEIDRFDGSIGHVLISSAPIHDAAGRMIGALVVNTDVTERHAAALDRERMVAALEFERSRLASIFEEAPSFLAVLRGPDYVFERVNPAYEQLVGHRDPSGKALLDALPEIRGQGFIELLDAVRETGVPFFGTHTPVHLARVPGSPLETRYVDMVYQRVADGENDFAIVAHGVDVTDQVLATAALRRTEQLLRDQFAKLPVPTYLWERRADDFVLLESNEAAVRAAPAHGVEAIGQLSRTLFPGMDDVRRDMLRSLRTNAVVRCTAEFDGGAKFGRRRVDLTIGPQQPDRVLVHAVDTTARIELEAQLRQAQKMDAVGRLAGGVAHDFNNLLTVIGAHTSFLLESLDASDALRADAEAIRQAGVRAADLTRQLLAFSRKQLLKPTALDLNAIVLDTQKMLVRLLGEDITIVTDLMPGLGTVIADASQLSQVLMNLAVNARDAMPDGGTLTIRTRAVSVDGGAHGALLQTMTGEYALLDVTDTGVGMDSCVKSRLFEPFFTTKEPGKGTGLGLATVYGIVKQSAGYIYIDSAPAEGTTVHVYLPIVVNAEDSNEMQTAESVSVRGAETVLLIEDEAAVREIVSRILKRQGYIVLPAASGAEALAVSAAFNSKIDLVVSDAVMPEMSGAEVVRRLQEQRPALKALFMSGYTDDEVLRRGIVSSSAAFIQKPFSLTDFAEASRAVLDG